MFPPESEVELKPYFAGIDVGSPMTKAVILNHGIIASIVGPTGPEQRRLANQGMEGGLKKAGLPFYALPHYFATGYGRGKSPSC